MIHIKKISLFQNLSTVRRERKNSQLRNLYIYLSGLLFCLTFAKSVYAQSSIHIQVSPASGGLDDTYIMSVIVEGTGSTPFIKGGTDFKIDYVGPRTEVSIVNGHMTSRYSYIYSLTPKKEGQLLSPYAELSTQGGTLQADSVEITVKNESSPGGGRTR